MFHQIQHHDGDSLWFPSQKQFKKQLKRPPSSLPPCRSMWDFPGKGPRPPFQMCPLHCTVANIRWQCSTCMSKLSVSSKTKQSFVYNLEHNSFVRFNNNFAHSPAQQDARKAPDLASKWVHSISPTSQAAQRWLEWDKCTPSLGTPSQLRGLIWVCSILMKI